MSDSAGLFARHLSPGLAFALWGVFWFVRTVHIVEERNARHKLKQSSVLEHLAWRWEAKPNFGISESFVKIVCCASLLLVELAQGGWIPVFQLNSNFFGDSGQHTNITNYQHATMYMFFALSGIVDLSEHSGSVDKKHQLSHAFLGLAFAIEALLFFGHPNPAGLSARAHHLYGLMLVFEAALIFWEMRVPDSLWIALSKAFLLTLSGCWFIQVGAMLYVFDVPNTNESVALCHLFVAWQVFCLLAIFAVLHQVTARLTYWYARREHLTNSRGRGSSSAGLGSIRGVRKRGKSAANYAQLGFAQRYTNSPTDDLEKETSSLGGHHTHSHTLDASLALESDHRSSTHSGSDAIELSRSAIQGSLASIRSRSASSHSRKSRSRGLSNGVEPHHEFGTTELSGSGNTFSLGVTSNSAESGQDLGGMHSRVSSRTNLISPPVFERDSDRVRL